MYDNHTQRLDVENETFGQYEFIKSEMMGITRDMTKNSKQIYTWSKLNVYYIF